MPSTAYYSIDKTILDVGVGIETPSLQTVCKVQISTVSNGTSEEDLERFCHCTINQDVEITLGCEEGDISHIIDALCKNMKQNSRALYKIVFLNNSLFLPGENISFVLHVISWNNRAPPIYKLRPNACLELAVEKKNAGTRLFNLSRIFVATCFYSKAIKYLIVAHTSPDITAEKKEEALELLVVCHINLAACLLKHNKFPEVIANCTDALNLQPKNLKALYRRAVGYISINDFENARKDIETGIEVNPRSDALNNLAIKLKEKVASANAALSKRLKVMFS